MEAEQIGVVLARASELRSKLSICILERANRRGGRAPDDEEEESLVLIRDALASLEEQLASLQNLQQQQLYERESTLSQIDRSRLILLQKLKDYKGEELGLIHEAAAFAGESIKQEDDLLLPPYPRDLNDSLVLDDVYPSNFIAKQKNAINGLAGSSTSEHNIKSDDGGKDARPAMTSRRGGFKFLLGAVTKSAMTILSAIALLSFAGYEAKFSRNGIQLKVMDILQKPADEGKPVSVRCPPGKLLVMENGEARCMVKERVEIPFDADVVAPKVSYGFG